jgi:hypothetical protein
MTDLTEETLRAAKAQIGPEHVIRPLDGTYLVYQTTWQEVLEHNYKDIRRYCVARPTKNDEPVALSQRKSSSVYEHAVQLATNCLLDEISRQLGEDRYIRDLSRIHYSAEKRGEVWSVLAHVTYMRRRR